MLDDEVVEARAVLQHPAAQLWHVIGSPELYPRFIPEISWCEVLEPAERGRGPRCLVRVCPRRSVVTTQQVDALVYRPGELVVWCGVDDNRKWLSLELRPLDENRTELVVQMRMPGLDPQYSGLVSPAAVKNGLKNAAKRIDRHLAGKPMRPEDLGQDVKSTTLGTVNTLVRAGVVSAGHPARMARQLSAVSRWGATVAGGYVGAAIRAPHDPALQDERTGRTFTEVDERTNRLANALAAKDIRAEDRVAVLCRNHNNMVETLIACGKLGADVVLLNTGLSASAIIEVVNEHKPVAVLADDEFADLIEQVPGDFLRLSTWAESDRGFPTVDELIQGASDRARKPTERPGRLVVLTSGTTGRPKGARRPTPKGPSTAAALLSRIPLRNGDGILVAAPLFHAWGLAGVQIAMALRSPLSLIRKFDPELALQTLAERRCAALFAVPIMLQRILDLPGRVRGKYDLSHLRIVASSGSALSGAFVNEFMDAFGDKLYNLYGSTEVSWASIADPTDLRAAPTTAGRCPPGTRVAILDRQSRPVPPGAAGQIFVGNEMLFEGYTDGGSLPRVHELMATGDVGYLDADNRLFVSGRADEMIISGGENVFPRPVEEALLALPEVHDAAVLGVHDQEYGQRLAAYVVLRKGARLDAEDIRSHIHQKLARFAVPRDVFFVSTLPHNSTGKIVKRVLTNDAWASSWENQF